jgi:hypothetical protein
LQQFDDPQNYSGDFNHPELPVQDSSRDGKDSVGVDPKGRHHHGVIDVILYFDDGHFAGIKKAAARGREHEKHDHRVEGIGDDDGQGSRFFIV